MKVCLLALLVLAAAHASPVTYIYNGNGFTSFSGSPTETTADFVTVTLVFASALPANLSYVDESAGLQSWSISDGVNGFNQSTFNATLTAQLSTDGSGNITGEWNVDGLWTVVLPTTTEQLTTQNCPSHCGLSQDQFIYHDPGAAFPIFIPPSSRSATATPDANGWTTQGATPEPSTGWLLIGGALGLLSRRRYSRSS